MASKPKKTKRVARKRPAARAARPARPTRQQPESLRLRSIAASLTVNDLEKSMAWYRDVLRFTPGERWDEGAKMRGVALLAGSCEIYLAQDDFAKGRDRKKGEGMRLRIATIQDITAIAARIKASGFRLDFGPQRSPWGEHAFGITDPDGYKITVYEAH